VLLERHDLLRREKGISMRSSPQGCPVLGLARRRCREEIRAIYAAIRDTIESRFREFQRVWETGSEEDIFAELVFCILTPQSRAKSCGVALRNLLEKELLFGGDIRRIASELNIVRFKNKKARYIVEARRLFSANGKLSVKARLCELGDSLRARQWLVRNVKGLGEKEASHFLRNIGWGEHLAILDRHILKNLHLLGIIDKVENNLSGRRYPEIENRMKRFAESIAIPLSHLDFVLWYKETGEVLK
jgi:N-glycosylase/DNA lyase